MHNKIGKTCITFLLFLAILCLYPAMSQAIVAVQTEVVSGTILEKYDDHSVKLDNREIYLPSREGLVINLHTGEAVTLRYVVDDSDKKIFFEFAPGSHSLKNQQPIYTEKDNSPK